jgi:nucleoside-diphosphate-sugar epimerase
MKVIVTGHTGTIGTYFSENCVKSQVNLLNVSETFGEERDYFKSAIIHLAGIVGPSLVTENRVQSNKINVTNTLSFAEKALENGIQKFVFASTSHVYAKSDSPVSEGHALSPQNLYAEQKAEAESQLLNLFANSNAELSIVRIFSVLDWDCKDYTLGGLIRRIAEGDELLRIRNGDDTRDFLTPKSVCGLLESITAQGGMSGIWNLASGDPLSVGDAATRMLQNLLGENLTKRILSGHSETPYIVGNIEKLRNVLQNADFSWSPSKF